MWGPEFAVAECPMETPSWCLCLTLRDRSKEGTIQDRLQKARVSEATFGSMYHVHAKRGGHPCLNAHLRLQAKGSLVGFLLKKL